jgi:hypothetical protein
MSTNRKKAEEFILKYIEKLLPKSPNTDIYRKFFATMNDKEFDRYMKELEEGTKFLTVIAPNFMKPELTVENNFNIADELGHKFFQKLWIEGVGDLPTYQTPIEYFVLDLPMRRASQLLVKKISVPKHNNVIDALTGQPTGESKGAKVSYSGLQVCAAMGLDDTMVELMKYRGGDIRGGAALAGILSQYGKASMSVLKQYASGVESTKSLKSILTSAHLKSSL